MSQQQKCCQCLQHFTLINPPRSMPSCQHNICTKCLKQAIQHRQQFIDCAFCTKKVKRKDIKLFPKNLKLIQKIRSINSITPTPKDQKSIINSTSNMKNQLLTKQEDQLLITPDPFQLKENQNQIVCETHKKPLDIICTTDRKRVCPHCAIFGNHKDHKFKTLHEFQAQVQQKILNFLQITKKRHEKQVQMNLNNIKQAVNIKLDARKSLLWEQISKTFEEIIDQIRKSQKQIQNELQEKFVQVKQKLEENLLDEMKLKKSYVNWESSCQQIVNRLKKTKVPKNRIEIYYDSPLQICQEGNFFLEQMVQNLNNLYKQSEQNINAISIKTQSIKLNRYVTLIFPILDPNPLLNNQFFKIQDSFDKDFPSKNQLPTRQDLQQNSFIFQTQVSAIQPKQSFTQKKPIKNKLNKSFNSINSITNFSGFMNHSPKNRSSKNQSKIKPKYLFNQTLSPAPRRFGSPDFSKTSKAKQYTTPQEVLISLASNDFINEIDLSEMNLSDEDIHEFMMKAQKIRPIKAIKLQKNNITDEGFESICRYLEHVSNLNLSFNFLTDKCLDILIRNKEYFYKMRIINLSHNKISSDRTDIRIKGKLEQIKKLGIVVSL